MKRALTDCEVTGVTGVQASTGAGSSATPPETSGVAEVTPGPIPAESERPCYRVLDEWHEIEGSKYRPGVWHFGIKPSKGEAPATMTQQWVCSPLYIDAVTTDSHAGNFGRILRFKTTLGKWRTWAMPMELLRGDGSDLRGELLSMGVEIDPHARNMLAMYLQHRAPDKRIECALQTGWIGGVFVLPDEAIGPGSHGVAYQTGERGQDEYTLGGTLAGWQASIAAPAAGNPLLVLALCAGFAGPVLARCNAESGGIHFVGDSSTGKTTAIEAACSIWGGQNFRRSWRATSNGMEGVAALFNDGLLALDEISECDPREVGAIVYSLGNGRGKQRASRTGAARAVARWRCSVLSSGERTIATTMAEGGHRVKAGQAMRLLDVPAQRTHGAWDALHSHATGTMFSDAIKEAAATHYGHAGRAFLHALTRDDETDFAEALDKLKTLPEFQPRADEGQAKRAAGRFALLALAGELATGYGVTLWTAGEAVRAAGVGFAAWQELRGRGRGNLERDQVAEKVAGFIERHGDSRFSDADTNDERALTVRDRAGWWRNTDGERVYLFTAEGMRDALRGFDFNRALAALQDVGAIAPAGADGKRARTMRMDGRPVKLYEVRNEALLGN